MSVVELASGVCTCDCSKSSAMAFDVLQSQAQTQTARATTSVSLQLLATLSNTRHRGSKQAAHSRRNFAGPLQQSRGLAELPLPSERSFRQRQINRKLHICIVLSEGSPRNRPSRSSALHRLLIQLSEDATQSRICHTPYTAQLRKSSSLTRPSRHQGTQVQEHGFKSRSRPPRHAARATNATRKRST